MGQITSKEISGSAELKMGCKVKCIRQIGYGPHLLPPFPPTTFLPDCVGDGITIHFGVERFRSKIKVPNFLSLYRQTRIVTSLNRVGSKSQTAQIIENVTHK